MKNTRLAIALFVGFLSCGVLAAGQQRLSDRLISAAGAGESETVQLLLNKGANIEAKDNDERTALLMAAGLEQRRTSEIDSGPLPTGSAQVVDLLKQALLQREQVEQAQARDPQDRFAADVSVFRQHPQDDSLREKVIGLAIILSEPPAIPEEARQLFVLASSQIKQASSPRALDQPIVLLRKALEIAPWWANAYYNLSRALELRGQYDEAAKQLNYYLKLNPPEAEAREARAHLVVIQTEKEAAAAATPYPERPVAIEPPVSEATVEITRIPRYDPRGGPDTRDDIAGVVRGVADPQAYRVVLYAKADVWYLQPLRGSTVQINSDGTWSSWTHTGAEYAALLVRRGYHPSYTYTLGALPSKDGVKIFAETLRTGTR